MYKIHDPQYQINLDGFKKHRADSQISSFRVVTFKEFISTSLISFESNAQNNYLTFLYKFRIGSLKFIKIVACEITEHSSICMSFLLSDCTLFLTTPTIFKFWMMRESK
jgi:hypothetical protein